MVAEDGVDRFEALIGGRPSSSGEPEHPFAAYPPLRAATAGRTPDAAAREREGRGQGGLILSVHVINHSASSAAAAPQGKHSTRQKVTVCKGLTLAVTTTKVPLHQSAKQRVATSGGRQVYLHFVPR